MLIGKKKRKKKDNDRGESNRKRKSIKKKTAPNISRPTKKKHHPQGIGVPPPFSLLLKVI
jgi:hypothetical protein